MSLADGTAAADGGAMIEYRKLLKGRFESKEQRADIVRLEGMDINAQPIVAVEALLAGVELDEEEEMREMWDESLAEEMVQGSLNDHVTAPLLTNACLIGKPSPVSPAVYQGLSYLWARDPQSGCP